MLRQLVLATAIGACVTIGLAIGGCVEQRAPGAGRALPTPPPLADEPIHVQIKRVEPRLAGLPHRVLLDFEKSVDLAFVAPPQGVRLAPPPPAAHTGKSSLLVAPGAGGFSVKVSSVLGGALPGPWTVAGAYFYSASPASVRVSYGSTAGAPLAQGRTVELAAGRWTPVMMDLTQDASRLADTGVLSFAVQSGGAGPVYCDDVVVLDNTRVYEAPGAGQDGGGGWTVRQRGFGLLVERPNAYRMTLKTPEGAADGWGVEEANELRARFAGADGKRMTVYPDGRRYLDGAFGWNASQSLGVKDVYARQHERPADVEVAEEFGRVDRDTEGDRNNDAYNEVRGAYQLIAKGPRFEVRVVPKTPQVSRPVLEIRGMPAGAALVTVEGQWVDRSVRLADGTLLVELPMAIERAVTVNVSIK